MRKPIDQIVDRLVAKVRVDASGANSLAHVLVIVPTAQSGRRLRFKLAETFPQGVIPPEIRLPVQLAMPSDASSIASRTDEILAFMSALGKGTTPEMAAQFADIREVLGGNALTFADVASRISEVLDDENADFEHERWLGFAEIEGRYFAALASRGKTDRIVAMQKAIASPLAIDGVEEVFVACVLAPIPVMAKALAAMKLPVEEFVPEIPRLCSPLRTQIVPCATSADEAKCIAEIFDSVKPNEALPALCLADADEFREVQVAMQSRGMKIHDPSATLLSTSSLGHLVDQMVALAHSRSYQVFSAFIRGGDVRRWLMANLRMSSDEYLAALIDLDNRQAQLLPETIDDIAAKTSGKLRAIFEFVEVQLRKHGVRQLLQSVFSARTLDERDADSREFAAAAEVVNALVDECFAADIDRKLAMELFLTRLKEATYSLEPDEGDVVLIDGWLELPFLDADELVIAGFNEGKVPEAIVGHAFLPDRLRRGLGLVDNEARAKRDAMILSMALGCRSPESVKVLFRSIDSRGDVLKPSRLLFDCEDDGELVARVKAFYSIGVGTAETSIADLPNSWRLSLPMPLAHSEIETISPSGLDEYLRCPFTYCLKRTFGERSDDRAEELDAAEFGSLVHDALQRWGEGNLRDSEDAAAIADELAGNVDAALAERFGTAVPAIVALQGDSVKHRLANFAAIQAAWHSQGWRIKTTEHKLRVRYSHTSVNGRCDRVDYNERTGEWCVIDYKTFDKPDRAVAYDRKKKEWKSLQLPLYCAMLDADAEFPDARRECISSVYCVLGKTAESTLFTAPMSGEFVPDAENRVRELIDRLEHGIFWPPSPTNEWRWDFSSWIFNSPEESIDVKWLADQQRRIAEYERITS